MSSKVRLVANSKELILILPKSFSIRIVVLSPSSLKYSMIQINFFLLSLKQMSMTVQVNPVRTMEPAQTE